MAFIKRKDPPIPPISFPSWCSNAKMIHNICSAGLQMCFVKGKKLNICISWREYKCFARHQNNCSLKTLVQHKWNATLETLLLSWHTAHIFCCLYIRINITQQKKKLLEVQRYYPVIDPKSHTRCGLAVSWPLFTYNSETSQKPQGVPFDILGLRRMLTCICVLVCTLSEALSNSPCGKASTRRKTSRDQGSIWDKAKVKEKFSI